LLATPRPHILEQVAGWRTVDSTSKCSCWHAAARQRARGVIHRGLLHPCTQADSTASACKAAEERNFLRSLNEQLLANQKDLRSALEAARGELRKRDEAIKDLQEQVRARSLGWCCNGLGG